MSHLAPLKERDLPAPPAFKKLIGPSFILLGLGLGSGEIILWPYLSSNYGLGIIWGALLGITFQYFLNMEIERYTLVNGESVFVGLARKLKMAAPVWFILSTLLPWMWPGIIASSGTLFSAAFGIKYTPLLSVILLILLGLILTLGPVIYKTLERFQKILIGVGVPAIVILTFYLVRGSDLKALGQGLIGMGEGYWFFPAGLSLGTFLGAFAFAGAGGNLNLAQSFYIKEKGYGMGLYSGRITSLLTGKAEKVELEGTTFKTDKENLNDFKLWWKRINLEHLIIFWATGAFTMLTLSLLAYSTTNDLGSKLPGLAFVLQEAGVISVKTLPIVGSVFLATLSLMLFSTQMSVFDATSRIMSENLAILFKKVLPIHKIPLYYYSFLWLQIIFGIIIFSLGFNEPLQLVLISSVLNGVAMFIYSALILWLNLSSLKKPLRPGNIRIAFVLSAFLFYGIFSIITIVNAIL